MEQTEVIKHTDLSDDSNITKFLGFALIWFLSLAVFPHLLFSPMFVGFCFGAAAVVIIEIYILDKKLKKGVKKAKSMYKSSTDLKWNEINEMADYYNVDKFGVLSEGIALKIDEEEEPTLEDQFNVQLMGNTDKRHMYNCAIKSRYLYLTRKTKPIQYIVALKEVRVSLKVMELKDQRKVYVIELCNPIRPHFLRVNYLYLIPENKDVLDEWFNELSYLGMPVRKPQNIVWGNEEEENWFNALTARLFEYLRNSQEVEKVVRKKLMNQLKKKLPKIINDLQLTDLDMGQELPNLDDLVLCKPDGTGDTVLRCNWLYRGGIHMTFTAKAQLKLTKMPISITITIVSISGPATIRVFPYPSSRLSFCFNEEPQMELRVSANIGDAHRIYGWKKVQKKIDQSFEFRIMTIIIQRLVYPNRLFLDMARKKSKKSMPKEKGGRIHLHDETYSERE
eukprot:TRINITY_DN4308_c0_g1_i1.p1 TRINITY_DN4308_c0_g1~~TRINITY_DN4308_c0_g1_i1.p1  ORF type:complete len:450 (-),score=86.69 TRINITY_DN4308_c0_g1_i1:62-1411(-)